MRIAIACILAVILAIYPLVPLPARAASTELFFSEYIEGSSNNKALEIFNGTGAPIDLAAGEYNVQMFFNGSTSPGLTINLIGTVAAGDVFVLAQSFASPTIVVQADQLSNAIWFNGDDALVLRKGMSIIDVIGQIGFDPGSEWGSGLVSTADNTLRRKPSVEAGDASGFDPFDPTAQWDGFAVDTFAGLGAHPGTTPPPVAIVPIGTVQGTVLDTADGRGHRSQLAPPSGNGLGATARIQGVIYQKTQARTSAGGVQHGFFIQNTTTPLSSTADSNPNTSDGIFVFMFGSTTLRQLGGGAYEPHVGDEVVLHGSVVEFFNLTELSDPVIVEVVRSGVNIDAELPPYEAKPSDNLADAYRYWERREGMRGKVPANSLVVGRREVFSSTLDGEVWVIRPDHPVAQRRDPYARRVFRDPHPLDDVNNDSDGDDNGIDPSLFDNGNGYRILLGSLGIKGTANDPNALIAQARTFDRLASEVEGGTYFAFNKYSIMPRNQIALISGPDPNANAPVPPFDRDEEYRVATYNVENLYDFRDDPFDGCDFTGNAGCPGVSPPFDYVPATNSAYQARLGEIALQIIQDLRAPDIILIQEAEDQDVCGVVGGALACGLTNNADGKPDTLQELALKIKTLGGPADYDAAADRDGADDRGIISGFLYRADRVQLLTAQSNDPVLGSNPQVQYRGTALGYNFEVQNPKVLNAMLPGDVDLSTGVDGSNIFTRPPQIAMFRVWRNGIGTGMFTDLYVLSNHFSSGPDIRVGQRREQATYAAAIYTALKASKQTRGGERVVIGGDLNVYPRPDDPFTPGHPLFPSDQLRALYDVGLKNLWAMLVARAPSAAYSYVFEGQTQTLDQLFVTPRLRSELVRVWAAHVNSDWPQDHSGDGPRGSSDHDPQGADFRIDDD